MSAERHSRAMRGLAPGRIALALLALALYALPARAVEPDEVLADPQLDRLFDGLNPEQQSRAAALAATRIEGAALTSSSQASK